MPSVDWLLVDVEGFEERVLKGAGDTLKKTKRIIIEISYENRKSVLDQMDLKLWTKAIWICTKEKSQYFYLERIGDNV